MPSIPPKRYFTISEVSNLCGVKPHVLRYWEQEFTQLRPMKRRGNRRYYQHDEVLMIRSIRDLLYEQGFTIIGARNKLQELAQKEPAKQLEDNVNPGGQDFHVPRALVLNDGADANGFDQSHGVNIDFLIVGMAQQRLNLVRCELLKIRDLLSLSV